MSEGSTIGRFWKEVVDFPLMNCASKKEKGKANGIVSTEIKRDACKQVFSS